MNFSRGLKSAACFVAAAAQIVVATMLLTATHANASAESSAVTKSITETRSFLDATGAATQVDSKTVTLSVSQTTNLRGRQIVDVTWSGAHPTGGLAADVNSSAAALEEYPVVILECRGVDDATATSALNPQTCWTQSVSERTQIDSNDPFPPWRVDLDATNDERYAFVGQPTPRPKACGRPSLDEHWVPFVAADGTTYAGGPGGCGGVPPEWKLQDSSGLPTNTTYGITNADGTGSAKFDIWTEDENASLGCSATVPCSLVAVPIIGLSCDPYGTKASGTNVPSTTNPAYDGSTLPDETSQTEAGIAATECEATGTYGAGAPASSTHDPSAAVTGSLWWSPSNWTNRISIPLTFAVSPNICSVVSTKIPVAIYGSVAMNEVAAQWQPKFCTDKTLYPFTQVQTSDEAARNLVDLGTINAAFSSRPPDTPFQRPVAQAPVAISGFAITYTIDDASGKPFTSLRLDARLLAKLLTESYSVNSYGRQYDSGIAKNPLNLTTDPEFRALNPGLTQVATIQSAASLISLSTDADLIWALTSYINADTEARLWLNGTPDPWGMVVNPAYTGIQLPLESWPLLDETVFPTDPTNPDAYSNDPCYSADPVPYMSLVHSPTAFLSNIIRNVQFGLSNVQNVCTGDPSDPTSLKMATSGAEPAGNRFVLGLTTLAAARRYDLTPAALQTTVASAGAKFTNAAGRSFVVPDETGLKNAAALLHQNMAAGSWTFDYSDFEAPAGSAAYPGTMLVNADVPTTGLDATTAGNLATFLTYAATTGQQAGAGSGQLPDGYLPITKADGLLPLSTYTRVVALAVATQSGKVPALDAQLPSSSPKPTHKSTTPAKTPVTISAPVLPPTPTSVTPSTTPTTATPIPVVSSTPVPEPSSVSESPVALTTVGANSAVGGALVPGVILIGAACALAGGLLLLPRCAFSPRLLLRQWRP
jgi:hypothetical protein